VPAVEHESWFKEQVHVHDGQLKSWLRGQFPTVRQEVDDVVQESYLRLWRRQAAKPIKSVKAFLFKAARNVAIDFLRRNKRSPLDPMGTFAAAHVIDEAPDAAALLTVQEKYALLAEAMATLPDRCYEVIILHKFKGLSQREVAIRMGISEHTVANQVQKAIERCEAHLRAHGVNSLHG
jgi:RNA polymerase sigma factor (sigma-70 family)